MGICWKCGDLRNDTCTLQGRVATCRVPARTKCNLKTMRKSSRCLGHGPRLLKLSASLVACRRVKEMLARFLVQLCLKGCLTCGLRRVAVRLPCWHGLHGPCKVGRRRRSPASLSSDATSMPPLIQLQIPDSKYKMPKQHSACHQTTRSKSTGQVSGFELYLDTSLAG